MNRRKFFVACAGIIVAASVQLERKMLSLDDAHKLSLKLLLGSVPAIEKFVYDEFKKSNYVLR